MRSVLKKRKRIYEKTERKKYKEIYKNKGRKEKESAQVCLREVFDNFISI